jgi:hypothetical protein
LWIREVNAPLLDISAFLVQQVDSKPQQLLTKADTKEISAHCLSTVIEYARKYQALYPLNKFLKRDMFRASIVSYDTKHQSVLFGSFVVRVDSVGTPSVSPADWHEFSRTDKTSDDLQYLGETEYVEHYVYRLGARFFGPYRAVLGKSVSQTSLLDAKSAAMSLITAAEETARSVKPPSGIGGPIDVATITKAGVALERH